MWNTRVGSARLAAAAAAAAASSAATGLSLSALRKNSAIPLHRIGCCHVTSCISNRSVRRYAALDGSAKSSPSSSSQFSPQQLYLYNSQSRKKELFVPLAPPMVTMYVCGITAYDYSHLGHARVYVTFDVLYRLLLELGYDVTYARNFTDVDDKIIKRALETGVPPLELSKTFAEEFQKDMEKLNCRQPQIEPRVSERIPQIIDTINRIIDREHAYCTSDGDVYFSVESLPSYGQLARRPPESLQAGASARVSVQENAAKRHPGDFVLWKASKANEEGAGVSWQSPFGRGRPGWHIECTAMIFDALGESIDIHGGGQDLLFPHHENELAQAVAAADCCGDKSSDSNYEYVRYWLHNGFVTINSEKMSKSLGNFQTVRQITAEFHPLALRYALLTVQYRSPLHYSPTILEETSERVYYIFSTLSRSRQVLSEGHGQNEKPAGFALEAVQCADVFCREYRAALLDDLNTAQALALMSLPLNALNELLSTRKGRKAKGRMQAVLALVEAVDNCLRILGLKVSNEIAVIEEMKAATLKKANISTTELEEIVTRRTSARASKDFDKADGIRKELEARGIALMDQANKTEWKPIWCSNEKIHK